MAIRAFDTYPEIATERLRLRKPSLEDAGALAVVYGHPETVRYISYPVSGGAAKMHEKLTRDLEAASRGEGFRWVLCERGSDEPQGYVGLFQWSQADRRAEVGYVLGIHQWGKGVMKELMPAVLRFGFETLRLHRLEARVDPRNGASMRVLTRAGFQQEGLLRDNLADGAAFRDTAILSLLEAEWRKAR